MSNNACVVRCFMMCTVMLSHGCFLGHALKIMSDPVRDDQPDPMSFEDWRRGNASSVNMEPPHSEWGGWIMTIQEYHSCAGAFSSPSADQLVDNAAPENHVVALTDHIYVLCTKCNELKIPRAWSSSVSLVNGRESDRCLDFTTRMNGHPLSHWPRVAMSHKLIVMHAKESKYDNVVILEEDATLTGHVDWQTREFHSFAELFEDGQTDVVRLSYMPSIASNIIHGVCPQECTCKQVSSHVCKMQGICNSLCSSGAYVLSKRGFDKILQSDAGIDCDTMASLDAKLIVPEMYHQPAYPELNRAKKYAAKCVVQ